MQSKTIVKASAITIPMLFAFVAGGALLATTYAQGGNVDRPELTDEQKEVIEEIKELRAEGNYEEAQALAEEAGLPAHPGKDKGERGERNPEVKEALENGDYETFKELTADAPFADEIDEDTFEQLVEAHEYRVAGDHESARAIMEELGINKFHRGGAPHAPSDTE